MAVTCIYRCLQFRSLANCYYLYLMRGSFLCFFYNPYMSLFLKNFSFTCLHSFFTHVNISYGPGRIQSVGLCTQYTNEMCAPFCNSPNCACSTDCRMFSHVFLPWITVATRYLGLAELHNVRDSVAPRSYVDSRSQALSDS